MSMQIFVLTTRHLNSIGEWQHALDEMDFKLKIEVESSEPIADLSGWLPAAWNGLHAGFECWPDGQEAATEITEMYNYDLGGPWRCIVSFYFSRLVECVGAMMAAAAYAKATGGIVLDDVTGEVLDVDAAIRSVRSTEAECLTMIEAEASGKAVGNS